jgi:hypothetical protein
VSIALSSDQSLSGRVDGELGESSCQNHVWGDDQSSAITMKTKLLSSNQKYRDVNQRVLASSNDYGKQHRRHFFVDILLSQNAENEDFCLVVILNLSDKILS